MKKIVSIIAAVIATCATPAFAGKAQSDNVFVGGEALSTTPKAAVTALVRECGSIAAKTKVTAGQKTSGHTLIRATNKGRITDENVESLPLRSEAEYKRVPTYIGTCTVMTWTTSAGNVIPVGILEVEDDEIEHWMGYSNH